MHAFISYTLATFLIYQIIWQHCLGVVDNQPELKSFVCKVFLLSFVSDLPAKVLVLNFIDTGDVADAEQEGTI